jgi:uncharacterized Zn finger protein
MAFERDDIVYDDNASTSSARASRGQRQLDERRAAGAPLRVVTPSHRQALSDTPWGQAWNRHLMEHSHYASRMPRGRTLLRKGSVMDLDVSPGVITAIVAGTQVYDITIKVAPLDEDRWAAIQRACHGRIANVVDLLSGDVSPEVMRTVTHPEEGLFPQPSDLRCICRCPDESDLCEHSAAVLYAVGIHLDDHPSALFSLRHAAPDALVAQDTATAIAHLTAAPSDVSTTLARTDLADLFGIQLIDESAS